MTKYWNPERIQRVRQREIKAKKRALDTMKRLRDQARTYMAGNVDKNANIMLDVFGLPIRRRMIIRLRDGGAMSLSKLVEPFRITLPTALTHLRALELSGLAVTHKQGRVRMCALNKQRLKELAEWLSK